jgi:hypothetical protein
MEMDAGLPSRAHVSRSPEAHVEVGSGAAEESPAGLNRWALRAFLVFLLLGQLTWIALLVYGASVAIIGLS